MEKMRMRYAQYKKHYADCKTEPGTYDKDTKSIVVLVPEGRMKPSGVRGQRFHGYQLWLVKPDGKYGFCTYRAVSEENAMKQHSKVCKENGWRPCEPPEGQIARIFL